MAERFFAVRRTARYHVLGEPGPAVREAWFVLHGHGQLAGSFARHFGTLSDPARLVVAPEALNRFYLEPGGRHGAHARVGATWMTREDRLHEIEDYVRYLDALHHHVLGELRGADVRTVVLGFSQGAATAFRWACLGRVRPAMLIAWAGALPVELDATQAAPLRRVRIVRVWGTRDDMASGESLAAENARFAALGLEAEVVRFEGGHELDAKVLKALT